MVLKPVYSHTTENPYVRPFAGHNGKQLLYSDGVRVSGLDTQTSLVRWQGGELESVRRIIDLPERVLLIGEHIQVIDKERGQRVWDFPLNCFAGQQCNADVLAVTGDRLLVGGFGSVYNMAQIVSVRDGKEIWPNWVTTCGMRLAGIAAESVILVCQSDNPLIQRIDLASRRTLFAAPSPAPGFEPQEAWYSDQYVYVVGDLDRARKLYVFSTADGSVAGKFNIKTSGSEMGFVVSPDAGRFVPWQVSGQEITFWGIDVATGKSAWQYKAASGTIVGQVGSTLALLTLPETGPVIVGLGLGDGRERFQFPVPFDRPVATLQGPTLYVVETGGRRFVAVDLPSGKVIAIGTVPSTAGATPDTMYFASSVAGFVSLVGREVTLFGGTSIPGQVDQVVAALDSGNEAQAVELYSALMPFRRTLPEARRAFTEMTRFRWFSGRVKLRGKDPSAAVFPLAAALSGVETWSDEELLPLLPELERVALEVAMSRLTGADRDDLLLPVLDLLVQHVAMVPVEAQSVLVETAVTLARALRGGPSGVTAAGLVDRLQEASATAAFFDEHPYRTAKEMDTIQTTIELADQAFVEGDPAMASDLLKELAANAACTRVFGQDYDPWLDAAGLYLLPEDDQATKLPAVLKGLKSRFESGRRKIEKEADRALCHRACAAAGKLCPGSRCVETRECGKSQVRCDEECERDRTLWPLPPFNVSATSTTFNKCR